MERRLWRNGQRVVRTFFQQRCTTRGREIRMVGCAKRGLPRQRDRLYDRSGHKKTFDVRHRALQHCRTRPRQFCAIAEKRVLHN